jgi:hypothetical protein
MSRGIHAVNQSSVSKAIKGARRAGLDISRVEIDKAGKIIIVASRDGDPVLMEAGNAQPNEWDSVR